MRLISTLHFTTREYTALTGYIKNALQCDMSTYSNGAVCPLQMTSWVCTEILVRDTPSSRAMVIVNFIQIALYCYRHNDFHCSLNIAIALSSSIIRGLHKTWEEVDKKVCDIYWCILCIKVINNYTRRMQRIFSERIEPTSRKLELT